MLRCLALALVPMTADCCKVATGGCVAFLDIVASFPLLGSAAIEKMSKCVPE
jgi:hypothetical protein